MENSPAMLSSCTLTLAVTDTHVVLLFMLYLHFRSLGLVFSIEKLWKSTALNHMNAVRETQSSDGKPYTLAQGTPTPSTGIESTLTARASLGNLNIPAGAFNSVLPLKIRWFIFSRNKEIWPCRVTAPADINKGICVTHAMCDT